MDKQALVDYIQRLVDMSGSKSSGEANRIELSELVTEITAIKNQLANLSSSEDGLYYNEEEKLRDRQLEVQCQKRIRQTKNELEQIQEELDKVKKEEEQLNKELSSNSKSLSLEVIEKATKKIEESLDSAVKEHYEQIIAKEKERITKIDVKNADIQKKQKNVQDKMRKLADEYDALEKAIEFNEQILKETQQNLSDDNNYLDKSHRQTDIVKKENLESKLKELEEKQKAIINDPVMLGDRAKEALLKKENFTALNIVREIARQVGELPYMQVPNDEALGVEEVRLLRDRDDFFANMKGKKYSLTDNKGIDNRIVFLENCIKIWEKEIDTYQKEVSSIDLGQKYSINSNLLEIGELVENLENEVNNYNNAIASCDEKDIKKKVELQASLNYKKELLDKYKNILDSYKESFLASVEESKQLSDMVGQTAEKVSQAKEEIENLKNGKLLFDTEIDDVLGKDSDFVKLNELSKQVMAIKHRRKFAESPSEILQKFEHELGFDNTLEKVKNEEVEQQVEQNNSVSDEVSTNVESNQVEVSTNENKAQEVTASLESNSPLENLANASITPNSIQEENQGISTSVEPEQISVRPVFGDDKNSNLNNINPINPQLESISQFTSGTNLNNEDESQKDYTEDTNLSNLFNSDAQTKDSQYAKKPIKLVEQENISMTPDPIISSEEKADLLQNNMFDFSNYYENGQDQAPEQELKRVA